jgi:hypothetical protein
VRPFNLPATLASRNLTEQAGADSAAFFAGALSGAPGVAAADGGGLGAAAGAGAADGAGGLPAWAKARSADKAVDMIMSAKIAALVSNRLNPHSNMEASIHHPDRVTRGQGTARAVQARAMGNHAGPFRRLLHSE